MLILIEKDAATKVSKEVADLEEAKGFASNGFAVSVQNEDGTFTELSKVLAAQDPEVDAAAKHAAAEGVAFANSGKTEAQWKKLAKVEREKLIQAELDKAE
jgi:hypothetical protein